MPHKHEVGGSNPPFGTNSETQVGPPFGPPVIAGICSISLVVKRDLAKV